MTAVLALAIAAESYPKPSSPAPPAYAPKSYDYVNIIFQNFILFSFFEFKISNFYFQPPQPYSYSYDVKDAPSYNDFGHSESSDGKVVTGSYRVALPDGRTQIVTYKADEYGYVADVKYEGVAKYPEYKPAPAYKAAPYPAPKAEY